MSLELFTITRLINLIHSFYKDDILKLRSMSLLLFFMLRMDFTGKPFVTLDLGALS
jgi:hypothetical protein